MPISPTIQREILRVKQWRTAAKGIEVGEFIFQHRDRKWTKPRRYVVVCQAISRRPTALGTQPSLFKDLIDWSQYRFSVMITNDADPPPEGIWRA